LPKGGDATTVNASLSPRYSNIEHLNTLLRVARGIECGAPPTGEDTPNLLETGASDRKIRVIAFGVNDPHDSIAAAIGIRRPGDQTSALARTRDESGDPER
jgi:hypothetical protein